MNEQKLVEIAEDVAGMKVQVNQMHSVMFGNGNLLKRVSALEHWRSFLAGAWAVVVGWIGLMWKNGR